MFKENGCNGARIRNWALPAKSGTQMQRCFLPVQCDWRTLVWGLICVDTGNMAQAFFIWLYWNVYSGHQSDFQFQRVISNISLFFWQLNIFPTKAASSYMIDDGDLLSAEENSLPFYFTDCNLSGFNLVCLSLYNLICIYEPVFFQTMKKNYSHLKVLLGLCRELWAF